MTNNSKTEQPFTFDFKEEGSNLHLELTNGGDQMLSGIEVLTIVLTDEAAPLGTSSKATIEFKEIKSLQPQEKIKLSHKTWINGQPAPVSCDLLERLKFVNGEVKNYVLDISWQNAEGKSRFQRLSLSH